MKMEWTEPRVEVQKFVPDEYVAVCITGLIQCGYPGNGKFPGASNGNPDIFDDYCGTSAGYWTDSEGQVHGLCGYNAQITFNGTTGQGYEVDRYGVIQTNRPIYNIDNYTAAVGTYTGVTWTSNDQGKMGSEEEGVAFHHVGRLTITEIDENRPNHS